MAVTDYTCTTCGSNCGSTRASDVESGLCMTCRDDLKHADRPLCEQCSKHRVTCSQAAFDRGVRVCRGCSYVNTVDAAQEEYEPVFEVVEDFANLRTYVEQTGGMCMVGKVYLDADTYGEGMCDHCQAHITRDKGAWIDETEGDVCGVASADTVGENLPHTPAEGYPQIAVTWDTDDHWFVAYAAHWEDYDSHLVTEDLRSGGDERGLPIYGGENATAEEVAERILLLVDDPSLARS